MARTARPVLLKQGALDCTCAFYAVANAVTRLYPEGHFTERDWYHMLRVFGAGLASAVATGVRGAKVGRIVDALQPGRGKYRDLIVEQPWAKGPKPTLGLFLDRIRAHTAVGGVVLLTFRYSSGPLDVYSHATVITHVSEKNLITADSARVPFLRIPLRRCRIRGWTPWHRSRPYELCPPYTFFLSRPA